MAIAAPPDADAFRWAERHKRQLDPELAANAAAREARDAFRQAQDDHDREVAAERDRKAARRARTDRGPHVPSEAKDGAGQVRLPTAAEGGQKAPQGADNEPQEASA